LNNWTLLVLINSTLVSVSHKTLDFYAPDQGLTAIAFFFKTGTIILALTHQNCLFVYRIHLCFSRNKSSSDEPAVHASITWTISQLSS